MRIIITLLLLIVTSISYADVVDKKMQIVLQELSEKYVKKNPVGTVKKGLAVLNFSENSEKAKKAGIGTTIRENLSRKVISSNIFYLVDRDTLQRSISEIEMSQTGLVDDKSVVKAGKIAGVQVFITGSVSDIGNEFIVNFKVIDVETATVVAAAETRIPQEELIEVREKYAYEYIAQYGLGINVQYSYIPQIKCPVDGYTSYMLDTFLNYRPMLWLNFKLGVSYYSLEFDKIGNIPSATIFPTITGAPNYNFPAVGEPLMNVPITWDKSTIDFISPYIGLDYNYTPSRWFTIGFGVGMNIVKNIEYVQQYSKGFKDKYPTTTHGGEEYSPFIVRQNLNRDRFMYIYRFEIKPQVFISPRLTFGLYIAYMLPSSSLKVSDSTINNEASSKSNIYYNINPNIIGDGKNIEDTKLQGFMFGTSLNFYF